MSDNNVYEMSFYAPAEHVSTSGKLMLIAGRSKGETYEGDKYNGVDIYANLSELVAAHGGVPADCKVTIRIEAAEEDTEILTDCLAMVPRTMQNRYEEKKVMYSELYGHLIGEAAEQPEEKPVTRRGRRQQASQTAQPAKPVTRKAGNRRTRTAAQTEQPEEKPVRRVAAKAGRITKQAGTARRTAPADTPEVHGKSLEGDDFLQAQVDMQRRDIDELKNLMKTIAAKL